MPREKIPLLEDGEFRHFTRKNKPIRYKTKNKGDKEVDELLLMEKLPDDIDKSVLK